MFLCFSIADNVIWVNVNYFKFLTCNEIISVLLYFSYKEPRKLSKKLYCHAPVLCPELGDSALAKSGRYFTLKPFQTPLLYPTLYPSYSIIRGPLWPFKKSAGAWTSSRVFRAEFRRLHVHVSSPSPRRLGKTPGATQIHHQLERSRWKMSASTVCVDKWTSRQAHIAPSSIILSGVRSTHAIYYNGSEVKRELSPPRLHMPIRKLHFPNWTAPNIN